MSQTEDDCWEAKSQRIEKAFQKMAALPLILYIRIKGGRRKGGYMKSIGDRLGRWEKAKEGGISGIG